MVFSWWDPHPYDLQAGGEIIVRCCCAAWSVKGYNSVRLPNQTVFKGSQECTKQTKLVEECL